jgi:hypothetical protein
MMNTGQDVIGTLVYNGKTISILDCGDYGVTIPDLFTTNGNLPMTARIIAETASENDGVITIAGAVVENKSHLVLKKLFDAWSGTNRLQAHLLQAASYRSDDCQSILTIH